MSSGLSGLTPAAQAIARGGQQTGNAAAPPTNFVPIAIHPGLAVTRRAGRGGWNRTGPVQRRSGGRERLRGGDQ